MEACKRNELACEERSYVFGWFGFGVFFKDLLMKCLEGWTATACSAGGSAVLHASLKHASSSHNYLNYFF